MKHLKKFNESVEETKNWISEVMMNCKDIMLELEDVGIKTDVTRRLRRATPYDQVSVLIECIIYIKDSISLIKSRKSGLLEVKNRLIDYMESEGFKLINNKPYVTDGQFVISFNKSDIDNDYIAHLRYLKKYNIE